MASAGAIEGESGISEADFWDLRDGVGEPVRKDTIRPVESRNAAGNTIDRVGLPPAPTTVAKASHGRRDETDSPVDAPNSGESR
jgi:hypothetical protein